MLLPHSAATSGVGAGGNDLIYGETRFADTPESPSPNGPLIDLCVCFPANDTLHGGAGNDLLEGGLDSDRLDGGSGNDILRGDLDPKLHQAKQTVGDTDVVDYSTRTAPVTASTARGGGQTGEHDTYVGIEGITSGRGADTLTGQAGRRDVLKSGAGNDLVNTRDGRADRLDCGAGHDRYRADAKDKRVSCEPPRAEWRAPGCRQPGGSRRVCAWAELCAGPKCPGAKRRYNVTDARLPRDHRVIPLRARSPGRLHRARLRGRPRRTRERGRDRSRRAGTVHGGRRRQPASRARARPHARRSRPPTRARGPICISAPVRVVVPDGGPSHAALPAPQSLLEW